jgi:polyisoprenyl-phosphate glycosyltransferase
MASEPATDSAPPDDALLILIPVFNDWIAVEKLLVNLDCVLGEHGINASVLLVDDGSTLKCDQSLAAHTFSSLYRVDVLELRRNLGHQRAIAIGLAYVEDKRACQTLILMDGDGEDDPRDIPRLLEKYREEAGQKIVFAERTRRSESWLFQVFYVLYKIVHYILTGYAVKVGNFSVVPRSRLASLVVVSELWNHYAAAVFRSRQPYCMLPTRRAQRLHGTSRMNFIDLVTHGLSAISVFSDIVGVRLLVVTLGMIVLIVLGIVCTVTVRIATNLAIPGWATTTVGVLLVLLFQGMTMAFIFSFVVLGGRQGATFLPRRDYAYFVYRSRNYYTSR